MGSSVTLTCIDSLEPLYQSAGNGSNDKCVIWCLNSTQDEFFTGGSGSQNGTEMNTTQLQHAPRRFIYQNSHSSNTAELIASNLTISIGHNDSGNYCCVASVTSSIDVKSCIILSVSGLFVT